ncbi:MAG: hypothetical protein RL219_1941 [Actinomycetota bacterium]
MRTTTMRSTSRVLAAVLGVGALATLVACSDESSTGATQSPAPAHAVTVNGVGIVKVVPDVLDLSFGSEAFAPTAVAALTTAGNSADAMVKYLKSADVDAKDIRTSQVFLSPTYDYNDGTSRITGYQASVTIDVRMRDTSKATALLDGLSGIAGNTLRLRSMAWAVDDPSAALDDARSAAMKDAINRASVLAKAGDVRLGDVISISESSQSVQPPSYDRPTDDKGEGASPNVPFEPGTESITVNVAVVVELD